MNLANSERANGICFSVSSDNFFVLNTLYLYTDVSPKPAFASLVYRLTAIARILEYSFLISEGV